METEAEDGGECLLLSARHVNFEFKWCRCKFLMTTSFTTTFCCDGIRNDFFGK